MADLVVVAFDRPDMADQVLHQLTAMSKEQLIELEDACVVIRPPEGEIQLKQMVPLTKMGALSGGSSGALWGALVGLLFLNPLAGAVVGGGIGAATGALAGQLSDYGIDDDFIRRLGSTIKPDSSALFLLIRKVTGDKVLQRLREQGVHGHVLQTSLSNEQEAALKKALSDASTEQAASGAATAI
ncbi:DUF1269 domain-containing protein [Benzoatithermus flavus]|uniref:DUF1269 domain-containing protein n=1 Tax=Benzoatithermus flavus TaxID=3108223 RepID=A0ABU8XRU3_9PROT